MDKKQSTPNPLKNKHLTITERIIIELMLKGGKTSYGISKALERPINASSSDGVYLKLLVIEKSLHLVVECMIHNSRLHLF